MANAGKFVDRAPTVPAAGIVCTALDGAGDALKIYSKEEAAENIMKTKCNKKMNALRQRPIPQHPIIPDNQLNDALSPELTKSRFVAFRERLTENMYFKKHQVGKVFDLQSKPEHVTNLSMIFGKKLKRSDSAYEVVLPRKDPDQVNREYIEWHNKYIVSHNHYFPSERINRHYDRTHFNPSATFGIKKNVDITGGNVKRCMTTCGHTTVFSKVQNDFTDRTTGKLGRQIGKFVINPNILPDMTFGIKSSPDAQTVQSLLENVAPGASKKKLIDAIGHIYKWRRFLYRSVDFHMHDLSLALDVLDVNDTGHLSVADLCQAAYACHIRLDQEKLRIVLRFFNMIEDECCPNERVNSVNFWKLLIMQHPLPSVGKMFRDEGHSCAKDISTTYRQLCLDIGKEIPVESERAKALREYRMLDITTAKDLVQPEIPMKFGLCLRDFELPRGKEELRNIFKTVVPEGYDDLWQRAIDKYKPVNELISVNQLRAMVND